MEEDTFGFSQVVISQDLCVDCGKCVQVCPVTARKRREWPKVYAAWSKDGEIRKSSSSGGLFSELARQILAQGGVVYGASLVDPYTVQYIGVDKEQDLEKLRRSKYVQSQIGMCYREVKKQLDQGKAVLFCGLPCQVAGLQSFLSQEYEKLYTIRLICGGADSPLAYRKYVETLEIKHHTSVQKIVFRDKAMGWKRIGISAEFKNGGKYSQDQYHDPFMRGYIEQRFYLRPSCGQCLFKGVDSEADITLGDFWKVEKRLDSDEGTSLVLVHTPKGEHLFASLKNRIFQEQRTVEEALKGNSALVFSKGPSKFEPYFFEMLKRYSFHKAYAKTSRRLVQFLKQRKRKQLYSSKNKEGRRIKCNPLSKI